MCGAMMGRWFQGDILHPIVFPCAYITRLCLCLCNHWYLLPFTQCFYYPLLWVHTPLLWLSLILLWFMCFLLVPFQCFRFLCNCKWHTTWIIPVWWNIQSAVSLILLLLVLQISWAPLLDRSLFVSGFVAVFHFFGGGCYDLVFHPMLKVVFIVVNEGGNLFAVFFIYYLWYLLGDRMWHDGNCELITGGTFSCGNSKKLMASL